MTSARIDFEELHQASHSFVHLNTQSFPHCDKKNSGMGQRKGKGEIMTLPNLLDDLVLASWILTRKARLDLPNNT